MGVCLSRQGKLCLQHEDLAKESALSSGAGAEVGIDVKRPQQHQSICTDSCARLARPWRTALPPSICTCLKDPNPFYPKAGAALLTGLLQSAGGEPAQRPWAGKRRGCGV